MAERQSTRPLGEALEAAYRDALERWTREKSKGTDPDTYLTSELTDVTITAKVSHRQGTYVYIEVGARKPWDADTYGYRLLSLGRYCVAPGMKRVV